MFRFRMVKRNEPVFHSMAWDGCCSGMHFCRAVSSLALLKIEMEKEKFGLEE
jgi:hypothetical protein